MCYDLSFLTRKAAKYAKRFGSNQDLDRLQQKLQSFHAAGFEHPQVPVITTESPGEVNISEWGLIPHWARTLQDALKIRNRTINARDDGIFKKPSFRDAAKYGRRCLVLVDGFFEHHHKEGKTYPYYITRNDEEPFALAGLWSIWEGEGFLKHTFTIITTRANETLTRIHNNPKLEGPRMPVIIPENLENTWLKTDLTQAEVENMLQPFEDKPLKSYTVPRLRGKNRVGNRPEAIREFHYAELESSQGGLF